MESLARTVALIVSGIVAAGVVSLAVAFWPARSGRWSTPRRLVGGAAGVLAVVSGAWLAGLPVGVGGRLIGVAVQVAGLTVIRRAARRSSRRPGRGPGDGQEQV